MLILLSGAGYRFYLAQYEEVCRTYQQNVTAIPRCLDKYGFYTGSFIDCPIGEKPYVDWFGNPTYRHEYIKTNVCIEYMLVRKTKIEPIIYDFNWCEVYPNSNECK